MPRISLRLTAIALTLLVMCTARTNAQALVMLILGDEISSPNFVGGINVGFGYTTLNDYAGSSYRVNWMFGAYLNWRLSEHWHFAPEVTFKTPAGANGMSGLWEDEPAFYSLITDRSEWTELSYISIPLLARYTQGHFGVLAGPQIGYLMAATDNLSGTGPNDDALDIEKSAFGRMNRWDAGVLIGLEFLTTPAMGIHSMRVSVRYYQGFLDAVANVAGTQTNSGFYTTVSIPVGGAPTDADEHDLE